MRSDHRLYHISVRFASIYILLFGIQSVRKVEKRVYAARSPRSKVASRHRQVFGGSRVPLLCHLNNPSSDTSCHLPARSIATSPLWLKTVSCGLFLRCFAPPRRASAIVTAIISPRNDKAVRNLLSLPPRGKVDCRSIAKARRMRGKRRYVYYRDSIPLIRLLGSLRLQSCQLPARSIDASPLWLKTVTCGLFLRCFAPPRRATRGGRLFKTVEPLRARRGARHWQVGRRVCVSLRFYRREFLGGEPSCARGRARVGIVFPRAFRRK